MLVVVNLLRDNLCMSRETYDAGRGVYLILRDNNKALFLHRNGTSYLNGKHMLPGGRVDAGEQPTLATARETLEEVGIIIDPANLVFSHFMYRAAHDESGDRVDIFFETDDWEGTPSIKETNKCDGLEWFELNNLPVSVPDYVKQAIELSLKGITYSEYDF